MWKLLRNLLLVLIFIGSVGFGLYSLDQNGYFDLQEVSFEFNEMSDPNHTNYYTYRIMEAQKHLHAYKGQGLWRLPMNEILEDLSQMTWIEEFQVWRRWPNQLSVAIKPKAIRFLVPNAKSGFHPVVGEGDVLPAVQGKAVPDAMIMQLKKNHADAELIRKAVSMVKEIPEDGVFSQKNIAEIQYEPKDGFWVRLNQENIRVRLGEDQFAVKSARISQVLDYTDARNLRARVIDADLSKKVLVKLRKGP